MESISCNFCANEKLRFLFSGRDYTFPSIERFNLVRCNNCGLVFLNPRPTSEEMGKYYPLEYHKNYGRGKRELQFLQVNKAEVISKFKNKGKILDIGCQKGDFLKEMEEKGWDVYGVDISRFASEWAKKELKLKNIYEGDILFLDFPEGFFDIVTLWQVIEHLRDPLATLKKINKILKKDGILIIECPNFSSLTSRLFKDKWQPLDLPRHLYQFSPQSIKKMADISNFRVLKIDHRIQPLMNLVALKISILRFLDFEVISEDGYLTESHHVAEFKKIKIPWKISRGIFSFFSFLFSWLFAVFKSGDIICVYCRVKK